MPTTIERITAITAAHVDRPIADIQPDTTFASLGCDSLDQFELTMALEDEFGVEIPDEEAIQLTTPAQAAAWLERHGVAA